MNVGAWVWEVNSGSLTFKCFGVCQELLAASPILSSLHEICVVTGDYLPCWREASELSLLVSKHARAGST